MWKEPKSQSKLLTWIVLLGIFTLFSGAAYAQESVVCAAVYPCDQNGEILQAFNSPSNPCFDVYFQQCAFERAKLESGACDSQVDAIQKAYVRLRSQLERMKRKGSRNKRRKKK